MTPADAPHDPQAALDKLKRKHRRDRRESMRVGLCRALCRC